MIRRRICYNAKGKKLAQIKSHHNLILLFLILFHGICNYIWLSYNPMPPFWDESRYLLMGLKYKDLFSQISSFNFGQFAEIGGYYPPLFLISSLILTFLWGDSIRTMAMTNIIYMVIMLFSIFKIGEKIFDRKTGLWAAFILSIFPIIFGTSRMFLLDYALSAMVTLSIYLLLLTDYFKNTKNSILFGYSLGLGMLTKNTFGGFIVGPLFYTFYSSMLKGSKEEMCKRIVNLFYSLSIGVILALPWYVLSFPFALHKLIALYRFFLTNLKQTSTCLLCIVLLFIIFVVRKTCKHYSLSQIYLKSRILIFCLLLGLFYLQNKAVVTNILWYFYKMDDQVGVSFFILFIFVCNRFLSRKQQNTQILFLWLWIAIPYFLSYFFTKQLRYTMPYLPAVALIIAAEIQKFNNRKVKKFLLSSIFILSLVQFSIGFLYDGRVKVDDKITEILKWIDEDAKKKMVTVGLIVNTDFLNHETLSYYAFLNKLHIEIKGYVSGYTLKNINLGCFESDYIITLSDPRVYRRKWNKEVILILHQLLQENSEFVLVKEVKMPYYMAPNQEIDNQTSFLLSSTDILLYIYKKVD